MWCWRKLLRVPWTARRSNQSILKEINPEYSLEGLMLKLKLRYFGHLMWRADTVEKTLMLGKIRAGGEGGDRGWDDWMASLTQWTWVWAKSGRQLKDREVCGAAVHRVTKSRTWLSNWTITAATLIKNWRMGKCDKIKGVQNDKFSKAEEAHFQLS